MSEIYSDFAEVYDELMDRTPYAEWCETLVSFIEKYGISKPVRGGNAGGGTEACPQGGRDDAGGEVSLKDILASERNLVVDLGCGTGTLTELLYEKGYDMIGVDNSPDMLGIAMGKREESGSEILYLQQDMRELELYSTVGTIVSVCDSINYILKEHELREIFSRVNNYLYPGGLFIFDFNTEYKYREVIGDATIAENRENCSFIWENYYDRESALNEYDVTVFLREKGELFRRFTETHLQRGYAPEQMESLVQEAGLQIIELRDADTQGPVTDRSERVYIVAREQGKSS